MKGYSVEYDENTPIKVVLPDLAACQKIVNKLTRHFKMPDSKVFLGGYSTAKYYPISKRIRMPPKRLTMFLLVHEVSHHWDCTKNGHNRNSKYHTKKQRTLLRRLWKYCVKMNFWGYETIQKIATKEEGA